MWPATFAFSNDQGFHAVAPRDVPAKLPMGYLGEEQVKAYPEGRYELAIQTAFESGSQADLDLPLTGASSQDMLRLATLMVLVAVIGKFVRWEGDFAPPAGRELALGLLLILPPVPDHTFVGQNRPHVRLLPLVLRPGRVVLERLAPRVEQCLGL